MRKTVRDLNLGWIRGIDVNGNYIWKCYDPETKELIKVYRDEQLVSEKEEFKYLKEYANGVSGVYLHKSSYEKGRDKIWECRLTYEKKKYYVGMYASLEDAATAYNQKVTELGLNKPLNDI